MKALVAAATVALVFFVPTLVGYAYRDIAPGPARITVTANPIGKAVTVGGTTTREYALFNRPDYPNRLGTMVSTCRAAEPLWSVCRVFIWLSRGIIICEGIFPQVANFKIYAITGGTGYYANIGGTLTLQPLAGQVLLATAKILAF